MERLRNYGWAGNVRELEILVERELILHRGGKLTFDSLVAAQEKSDPTHLQQRGGLLPEVLRLEDAVAAHLRNVLQMTGGKMYGPGGAAELLDMNPSTLRWRLEKLGIPYGRHKKGPST